MEGLDPSTVAQMRWVLKVESDRSAKARLVILGFQLSNITELDYKRYLPTRPIVGAAVSRTLQRRPRPRRCLLLSLRANKGYLLKAGDVTSAFLQVDENLKPLG